METRSVDTRTLEATSFESANIPLDGIRWPAVFAGLAVGLGVHLLLMLFGIAFGLAVYGAGQSPDGGSVSIAAAVWNTISMLIAALVGGFVAARSSGLRRNADGMIHGVVAWGAAMLFFAALTGSVTGTAVSGMFGMAASPAVSERSADSASMGELLTSIQRGDRESAVRTLRERFGLTEEQAGQAADRAMAMTGSAPASPEASSDVRDTAKTAAAASTWLSAMILLSLLAGAGGGLLGAHGARNRALHGRYDEQRIARAHATSVPLAH